MEEAAIAFGGVVIGGVIAALTNAYFAWRAERDRQLGLAFSIFFKLFAMGDLAARMVRHLNEALGENQDSPIWPRLMQVTNVQYTHEWFTPEELALFAREKGPLFSGELAVAVNHASTLIVVANRYNVERKELGDEARARGLVTMKGGMPQSGSTGMVGTIEITEESDAKVLLPKIAEVESLAVNLRESAGGSLAHIKKTAAAMEQKLKKILKDERFRVTMDFDALTDGSAPDASS